MPVPAPFHALPPEEALRRTESSPEGLASEEATRRLSRDGPNALREARPVRPLAILLAQFESLVIWLLVAAAVLSGALGEWLDATAILAIVVLNAVVGFLQEYRAERSLAALRRMTAPSARVRRGGVARVVPAEAVVVGDVVELEAGDLVPGDARLFDAHALRCVEAALTGESEPVQKDAREVAAPNAPLGDRAGMVFLGTSVAAGRGAAVVVATGMATEMGRIAALLERAASEGGTPLQRRLDAFGRVLVWASLAIVVALFGLGLLRGIPPQEIFLASVSLAVAAVPEGLPAVVTVALAVGVQRMARRGALVRRLHAVETLGSTTVICTDKTGTLTVGEMTVRVLVAGGREHAVSGEGYAPEGEVADADAETRALLTAFAGCCTARLERAEGGWRVAGDPTEGALLAAARKAGILPEEVDARWPVAAQIPFDSQRMRMTVVRRRPEGGFRAFVKGAPDVLLALARDPGKGGGDRDALARANAALAERGLRVLAAAYRDLDEPSEDPGVVERDLVLLGLAGMQDPPRPEAKGAVARCREAGIRPVMITGDHPRTALAIAREVDIARDRYAALAGPELDRMEDAALEARVDEVAVYARVTAEHKLRIVRAWRARGGVVAMTGDGVNDAPAIRGADIGIAMGRTGTEVTKEASDMVITDDDFATIVAAVEEGRGIYENIRKTIHYLLAGNAGELLLMGACVAAGLPLPLLPIQLLWINLVTDGIPALCLATDPIDRDVMRRPPRPVGERLVSGDFLALLVVTGLLSATVAFVVFLHALEAWGLPMARSHAFSVLVFAEIFKSFAFRSMRLPLWRVRIAENLRLVAAALATLLFQLASFWAEPLQRFLKTPPMPAWHVPVLIGFALLPLVGLETWKMVRRRR